MMLAHIMGVPAEETLLQLAPAGAAMVAALALSWRSRVERLKRGRWRTTS
jgi:hypothetical protein